MIRHLTALILLLLAADAWAGEIKGDRKIAAHKMARLESDIAPGKDKDGKLTTAYSWKVEGRDAKGKDVEADIYKHDQCLKFTGPPGRYKVSLTVVDFDRRTFDEATAVVTIGEGPGPDPGPTPVPPGPDPVPPPDPVSPLAKQLRPALASETDADKKALAQALAAVYAEGASQVRKGAPKTMGHLWKQMSAGATAAKVDGKIPIVQQMIAVHLSKRLPSKSSETISDGNRETIIAALSEVATALREIAP